MEDYEKLGVFYLGREYSLEKKAPGDGLILYDSKDLVTHAVCVGMTGSGKTGLCLSILEEAAIDGIPSIVIDPKGDLPNLLLTFPDLRAEDFRPWINEDDARQKGLSPDDYAAEQADLWKKGLAQWGENGDRIRRLRESAEFVVYTPGSNAGLPVSILKSFAAPGAAVLDDGELLQERIATTVTGLLGLVGVDADPIKSREHILLSTILGWCWKQKQDVDLAALIQYVQSPPVGKVGVLDLESFYPAKDRFGLVLALNNLLASPGFGAWLEGEALDIGQILHSPTGKPRVAIFSIAHLGDPERMFFVSLLLTQVLGWMRSQSGTNSLRALLYMDEIYGFIPPVANPPSKPPFLTLLKQARAFGLGIVLATQNPVDLDYKGLSNTGTWFLGRLQTDRDRARVLDGLEGAAAATGTRFNRQQMEQLLAGLGSRVFLMNNTHEDAPVVFQTRWTLCYLRGPLTRDQIKELMDPVRSSLATSPPAAPPPLTPVAAPSAMAASAVSGKPSVSPDVTEVFLPARGSAPAGASLRYQPMILGAAKVNFADARAKVDVTQDTVALTPVTDEAIRVDWDQAQACPVPATDLEKTGQTGAAYAQLPAAAGKAKNYAGWQKDFVTWLYGSQTLTLLRSPRLGVLSQAGESDRDFRVRLQQSAREQRDEVVGRLRQKYAPKAAALQERLRRAQQAQEREAAQAKDRQVQTAISLGTTLLGAFVGRKALGTSTLGRATTAARDVSRSMKERQDVAQAADTVEAVQKMITDLDAELQAQAAALETSMDPQTETLESIVVKPKKTNISTQLLALVWAPFWVDTGAQATPAWG